jgi:hypothetical protein
MCGPRFFILTPPLFPGKLTAGYFVKPPVAHSGNGGALEKLEVGREKVIYKQRPYKSDSDTGAGLSEEQLKQLFSDGVQFNVNQLQAGHGSGWVCISPRASLSSTG